MPHHIELFVGGCPLCERVKNMIELGKCAGCVLEVHDLSRDYERVREKAREYRIRCVPTIVIDGRIKVEGLPEFSFVCSDEFYRWLESEYKM